MATNRIRSYTEITEELIADVVSGLSQRGIPVTYIDPRSNIYGLMSAAAKSVQRLEYDLDRQRRAIDIYTAEGADLDALGAERGVVRYGPGNSGVVLVVYNSQLGVSERLASGSIVKSTGGVRFVVMDDTGAFQDKLLTDSSLMLQVQAISERPGVGANVSAYTINSVVSYGSGSSGSPRVLNLLPALGGEDRESDDAYRTRIVRYVSLLNNRTKAKYLTLLQESDKNVLRAFITAGSLGTNSVTAYVVHRATGGSGFTVSQLDSLRLYLIPFVFPDDPLVANVTFSDFQIELTAVLDTALSIETIYNNVVGNLARYLDLSKWPFGQEVRDDVLLSSCVQSTGIVDVDRNNFKIMDGVTKIIGNVPVKTFSLPRLTKLTLSESGTNRTYGGAVTVTQTYITYPDIVRPQEA